MDSNGASDRATVPARQPGVLSFLKLYKNLLIILIVLIAVLVVLVFIVIGLKEADQDDGDFKGCRLVKRAPRKLRSFTVHDAIKTSLVHSAAYLEIFGNADLGIQPGFLELELDKIDLTYGDGKLTMYHRGCADLPLCMYYSEQETRARGDYIWTIKLNGTVLHFKPRFDFHWPNDMRYSCLETRAIPCFHSLDDSTQVAQVVFKRLEIELNGSPELISRNRFSKQPYDYSCRVI